MAVIGLAVHFVKSLVGLIIFFAVGTAAHFRNTARESEPTSIAAMVRRNLNLPADDTIDDDDLDVADLLAEGHGRLTALRDEVNESDSGDLSAEAVEFAIAPLRQACAQIRARANDESESDAHEDPDSRMEGGKNGRPGDYPAGARRAGQDDEQAMAMRRRCIAEGQSGVVVSHVTRR